MSNARPKLTEKFSIKLTEKLAKRLRRVAVEQERSVNWLVTRYVKEGLDRDAPQT